MNRFKGITSRPPSGVTEVQSVLNQPIHSAQSRLPQIKAAHTPISISPRPFLPEYKWSQLP